MASLACLHDISLFSCTLQPGVLDRMLAELPAHIRDSERPAEQVSGLASSDPFLQKLVSGVRAENIPART